MCAGLLSNGSEERSARLMELGVGELLMTALRVHHSSPGVQQWALSAAVDGDIPATAVVSGSTGAP